jgi:hypothetical protein
MGAEAGVPVGVGCVWYVIGEKLPVWSPGTLSKVDGTDPKDAESEDTPFEAGADWVLDALSIVVGAGMPPVFCLLSVGGVGVAEEAEWLRSGRCLLGSLTDLGIPEACLRVVRC